MLLSLGFLALGIGLSFINIQYNKTQYSGVVIESKENYKSLSYGIFKDTRGNDKFLIVASTDEKDTPIIDEKNYSEFVKNGHIFISNDLSLRKIAELFFPIENIDFIKEDKLNNNFALEKDLPYKINLDYTYENLTKIKCIKNIRYLEDIGFMSLELNINSSILKPTITIFKTGKITGKDFNSKEDTKNAFITILQNIRRAKIE